MQLVAYGAQDVYLTGNPQITFFKVVYRRHTNFSMECIRQSFSGNLQLGGQSTSTISRNGDLIGQIYLQYKLNSQTTPNKSKLVSNFGNAMIRMAEIEIGGQTIDRQDGRFMQMYSDLTEPNPSGNPCGVCKHQKLSGIGANTINTETDSTELSTSVKMDMDYWIPFKFWFCRNPGLFLPLIALQYHEVKLRIELNQEDSLVNKDPRDPPGSLSSIINSDDFVLWVDYIYLDTDERRRFAQVSHEYLIEQVQMKKQSLKSFSTSSKTEVKLNFNHPVKELLWGFSGSGASSLNDNYFPGCPSYKDNSSFGGFMDEFDANINSISGIESFKKSKNQVLNNATASPGVPKPGETTTDILDNLCPNLYYKLNLNGHDRMAERDSNYFNLTQIFKHHSGYGSCFPIGATNVYSFALKPEEHQPSGTCNFSRIDNASLFVLNNEPGSIGSKITDINIYAINYNVLRIMSGMGGLAYSN